MFCAIYFDHERVKKISAAIQKCLGKTVAVGDDLELKSFTSSSKTQTTCHQISQSSSRMELGANETFIQQSNVNNENHLHI